MLVKDLIRQLQRLAALHGDVEVVCSWDDPLRSPEFVQGAVVLDCIHPKGHQ